MTFLAAPKEREEREEGSHIGGEKRAEQPMRSGSKLLGCPASSSMGTGTSKPVTKLVQDRARCQEDGV